VTKDTGLNDLKSSLTSEELMTPADQASKKKILLVDDHPIFRHGLRELLDRQLGLGCAAMPIPPPVLSKKCVGANRIWR
jgi:hypothetical protein